MNVLNVTDIERELRRLAARCIHPAAKQWVLSVARNHFISRLPEKDKLANFRQLSATAQLPDDSGAYVHIPKSKLPAWAVQALQNNMDVFWFDTVQPRRRDFWSSLEIIVLWLNNWKPEDTRLKRIDRIAFPVAVNAAVLWYKDVSENIWNYVTDKPVTLFRYDSHFSWVHLVTALQFEREGKLMGMCVGNSTYFNRFRMTKEYNYYSLRDKHNKPHVTLEVHKTGVIQCKGNSNRRPADMYQPYVQSIIKEMGWTVEGDHHHISTAKLQLPPVTDCRRKLTTNDL